MNLIGKLQPMLILCAALLGLLLSGVLANLPVLLIEWFLMLLLFVLFLTVDLKRLRKAFENIRFTAAAIFINFIITPFLAYILGLLFFANALDIRMGLLMLLVTPCTDWYLVFTALSKGNVELNMSILPINLVLQMVLMPVYLFIFFGSEIQMDIGGLLQSILLVLLTPFLLALFCKRIIRNKPGAKAWIERQSDPLQLLFLCLAVVVMFATEGDSLLANPQLLFRLFMPLLVFFAVVFFFAQGMGRLLKFDKKDMIALHFTTLARNSPLSLAIAAATFPERPLLSLSLVVGPLIELPILSNGLRKWNTEEEAPGR